MPRARFHISSSGGGTEAVYSHRQLIKPEPYAICSANERGPRNFGTATPPFAPTPLDVYRQKRRPFRTRSLPL